MVGRNERKASVLGLLLRDGSVTTRSLVERWNLSYSGAQASLESYRRHSLISRIREPGPGPSVYRYTLTITGRRKAAWFVQRSLAATRKRRPLVEPEVTQPIGPVLRPSVRRRLVIQPIIHGRRVVRPNIHGRRVVRPEIRRRRYVRPKNIRNRRLVRPRISRIGEEYVKSYLG